ncbi:PTS sugar transporter subunit IIA [bacterium]|nr:PTS sugar transporter subunit IIA [candidate division CSSED10-310 bacterium]
MRIEKYIKQIHVLSDVNASDKPELFAVLSAHVHDLYPGIDRERIYEQLDSQEKEACSYSGNFIGIPNLLIDGPADTVCLIARIPAGVDYRALDGNPVRLVFLVFSPPARAGKHIRLIARLARFACNPDFAREMVECQDDDCLLKRLSAEDSAHV